MRKRILSWVMTFAMVVSLMPAVVWAEEGGCNHVHDADCGYTAAVAGSPCSHEHDATCYQEVTACLHECTEDCYALHCEEDHEHSAECYESICEHECSIENGCIKEVLDCKHVHDADCGYVAAQEGTPCNHVHDADCGGLQTDDEPEEENIPMVMNLEDLSGLTGDVVYVGGAPDGETSCSTLPAAINALPDEGGTVVIYSDISQGRLADTVLSKPVTIVGYGDAVLTVTSTWTLGADLTFENINIAVDNKTIYANGHTLTFGEGVVMVTENTALPGFNLYGGYAANSPADETNIIIQSGLFRTVTGGGSNGAVTGDTNIKVSGGIITTLYGGGYNADSSVSGDVNIEITGGSIGTVYGSYNGSVAGDINIDIQDAAITTVYGGSAGASTEVGGDITIKVTDANVKSLYGGGNAAGAVTKGDVTITIENSELTTVYGGGNSGTVNGTAAITVDGSTITNLYGSGYIGKVNNATITVNSGNITNIYSAARGSVGIDDAEEDGGTVTITVNGGTITYLYAGASLGDQTVAALSQTDITGGKITSIYLGTAGNIGVQGETDEDTVAELHISGGKITNVYAGPSSSGSIYGNVEINLSGDGTITTLYGSGGNASGTVNGDVTITATAEAFANVTTYKEQANGKRTGSVILKITDGETPGVDEDAKITGAGTEGSPYIIKTDAQFYALGWALSGDPVVMAQGLAYFPEGATAESIRTASYALGGSFTIESGPTFGSMPDFFVGVGTTNYPFAGTFDGKKEEGYEITVQYDYTRNNIADEGNQYVGLFSVANGATIQNLKISDDSIYTLEQQVGVNLYGSMLLANAAGNCKITNCEVGGTVNIDFGERFFHNARFGFISGNFRGTIDHCEVTEGSTLTIHCAPTSSTNGMARGVGIAFCAAAVSITNSTSYADITVDVGTAAAIAFNHSTSDAKNITVENCVNYGALTADSGSVYAIASPEATIKDSSHMLKVNSGTAWKLDGKALAAVNGYIAIPVSSEANNSYDNAASLTDGSGVSYIFAADGNIYNTPYAGSGYTGENPFTENNPLIISSQADYMEVKRALAGSKEDLAAIFAGTAASSASAAEQKGLLAQAYLQIGDDFTITSTSSIGLGSTSTPFAGSLDGDNHTVTLAIAMAGSDCAGSSFVGILDSNASGEIKNLNLAGNVQIKDTTLNMNYAFVSALCQNVPAYYTVSNCNSSVNINYDNTGYTVNTSAMSKTLYLNGMAYEVYGTMTNCTNSGDITIKETTGNVYSIMTAGCAYKLYEGGTLENFTMSGDITVTTTEAKSNSVYVGGALVTTAADLTNCTHSGDITVDSATTSIMPVGGIVANNTLADHLTFAGCENSGEITVTARNASVYVGGIIAQSNKIATIQNGKNTGTLTGKSLTTNVSIGGLIGYGSSAASTLENFENTGDITAESAAVSYAGGIVGYGKIATATGGSNSGDISVVGNTISYVGGLVGNLTFAGADSSISDFTNEGEISVDCKGVDYVGGVVGYIATSGTLKQASNSGKVSVSGQSSDIFVGGILGTTSNVGVEGCVNTGAIQSQLTNSNSFVGGISGRMTSGQVLDSINTGSVAANYTGFRSGTVYIGGIVGQVVNAAGYQITRTVSQGQVYGSSNGTGPIYAGGIMGVNSCTEANAQGQ